MPDNTDGPGILRTRAHEDAPTRKSERCALTARPRFRATRLAHRSPRGARVYAFPIMHDDGAARSETFGRVNAPGPRTPRAQHRDASSRRYLPAPAGELKLGLNAATQFRSRRYPARGTTDWGRAQLEGSLSA
jgi:hypothetical protein